MSQLREYDDDYLRCRDYHTNSPGEDGFHRFEDEGKFYFAFIDLGIVVLRSEGYASEKSRDNGIESVKKNMDDDENYKVIDLPGGQHALSLMAQNGMEIARSCAEDTPEGARSYLPSQRKAFGEEFLRLASVEAGSIPREDVAFEGNPANVAATPAAATSAKTTSGSDSDDYMICREYQEKADTMTPDSNGMIAFQHENNNEYYFAWVGQDGKVIMRSEGYPTTSARDNGMESVLKNRGNRDRYKVIESHGAYFLALKAGNHQEIARSCGADSEAALWAMLDNNNNEGTALAATAATATAATAALISEEDSSPVAEEVVDVPVASIDETTATAVEEVEVSSPVVEEVIESPAAESIVEVSAPSIEEVEEVVEVSAPVVEVDEEVSVPAVESVVEVPTHSLVEDVEMGASDVEVVSSPVVEEVVEASTPVVEEVIEAPAPAVESVAITTAAASGLAAAAAASSSSSSTTSESTSKYKEKEKEDDYLHCDEYKGYTVADKANNIAFFKHKNGQFYFVVYNKNGSIRLRSEGFRTAAERDQELKGVVKFMNDKKMYSTIEKAGYVMQVLKDKSGREVGRSCPEKAGAAPVAPVETSSPIATVATAAAAATVATASTTSASSTKTSTTASRSYDEPVAAPVSDSGSGFNWMWLLLPLLLAGAFFGYKSCNKTPEIDASLSAPVTDTLSTTTTATVDTTKVTEPAKTETAATPAPPSCDLNWIFFDFDKYNIKSDANSELSTMAKILKDNPTYKGVLRAHTDSKGDDAYNQRLSQNRANAAKDVLVSMGIDAGRISTTANSEGEPLAQNTDDDTGRRYNRRVELFVQDANGKDICKSIPPTIPSTVKK